MQYQHNGVRYHRRYLKLTPFVAAALITLGFGFAIAVVHSGIGTLFCLMGLFPFLILFYLEGPAKTVTVRNGTLEVRNSIHRYEIPPSRILSIEHMATVGVLARVAGHKPIWVGVFSRSRLQGRQLPSYELKANAKSLSDALFATPAPADGRQLKVTYRWFNVLLAAAAVLGLLALEWLAGGR